MKHYLTLLLGIATCSINAQQNTGKYVFNFLNHATSARMTAMGGNLIGVYDTDVSLAWFNPAVLHKATSGQVSFNYDKVFAGIGSGYVGYAHQVNKIGMTMHAGLQYFDYGKFDATDEFSNVTGSFSGQDIGIAIGASKPLSDKWNLGINAKYIHSNLESYNASGLSTDVGAMYHNDAKRFSFGIVAKNAGVQLGTYSGEDRKSLPFEIQLGISKRLKHLPLSYHISYNNLERWNLRYDDPNLQETDIFGQPQSQPSKFAKNLDNLARHLTVGTELSLGAKETFRIRLGYNHLLKKEMSVSPFRSLTGFSYGFGLKIKKFRLDLGRSTTHRAGAMTHFSFSTNINEFRKK